MMTRGVLLATDLIIRNDRLIGQLGNQISYTSKVSAVVASQFAHINVNYLDSVLLIALVCVMPCVMMMLNYLGDSHTISGSIN